MASSKNYTEVLIGGKVFTLSGFESEEYLQKVSTYLNHKIEECSSSEGYRKQNCETRNVLLALNIADDYFKARKQGASLESDIEAEGQRYVRPEARADLRPDQAGERREGYGQAEGREQGAQMKIVELETQMKNKQK